MAATKSSSADLVSFGGSTLDFFFGEGGMSSTARSLPMYFLMKRTYSQRVMNPSLSVSSYAKMALRSSSKGLMEMK